MISSLEALSANTLNPRCSKHILGIEASLFCRAETDFTCHRLEYGGRSAMSFYSAGRGV